MTKTAEMLTAARAFTATIGGHREHVERGERVAADHPLVKAAPRGAWEPFTVEQECAFRAAAVAAVEVGLLDLALGGVEKLCSGRASPGCSNPPSTPKRGAEPVLLDLALDAQTVGVLLVAVRPVDVASNRKPTSSASCGQAGCPPMADRTHVAAHEAGHATVAALVGRRPTAIDLDGPMGYPYAQDTFNPEPLRQPPPTTFGVGCDEATILLAGALGEGLAGNTDAAALAASSIRDREQTASILAAIAHTDEERRALGHALTLRASALLESHKGQAVHEHLTTQLLRTGRLSGEELRVEVAHALSKDLTETQEAERGPRRTAAGSPARGHRVRRHPEPRLRWVARVAASGQARSGGPPTASASSTPSSSRRSGRARTSSGTSREADPHLHERAAPGRPPGSARAAAGPAAP